MITLLTEYGGMNNVINRYGGASLDTPYGVGVRINEQVLVSLRPLLA